MTEIPSTHLEPVDDDRFVAELRSLSGRYWHSHPFHRRMHAGELTRDELKTWAANRWYYQSMLPQKDAAIVSNCPVPDVRRLWVERIVYHDGRSAGEGGCHHWLRLCDAVGLDRAEVLDERHVVDGVRFAVDAYVSFARTRPWVEAVASGLTEMFSGPLMRRRVTDMLSCYPWIAPDALTYFTTRLDAVADQGAQSLAIVVRHCTTREQQRAAIAALAFKCDVLWAVLDAIDGAGATSDRQGPDPVTAETSVWS
jgi:pyrroloquinoline-quinone synthase